MLKVSHTAWPIGRMPAPSNEVKEGGLWYRDEQEQLLSQAKGLARKKPKDGWHEFAKWFWAIIAIGSVITFFILNRR